ncbi:MAG TPA: efflux RND transporter periplasmic adaptor subunit [Anaerolineales bacterium]|nr:efflux RND transporter periplasmic adaptor subunit [Anaerolineales bacterium]
MKPKLVITLLLITLFATACSASAATETSPQVLPTVTADSAILAEGRLEPVHAAEIAFTASGMVSEVLVQEGQPVKKGEALIHLGEDTNYAAARLELVTAQKALNDLKNSSGADLAQAVIDLKDAQETYDKAADYLEYLQNAEKVPQTETRAFLVQTWKGYEYRYKTKNFKGPAPQDWIVEAQNDLTLKKARLDAAQRTYDRLKDGVDAEQLVILEAQLHAAQARVASFSVTAPFDGIVAELNAEPGGSINAGEPAVTVADFSEWLVKTTDLTEIDVVQLAEGQPVTVRLDAIPTAELAGTILSIGQSYQEIQGDIVYEVAILLDEAHPAMRWGMTAAVTFEFED